MSLKVSAFTPLTVPDLADLIAIIDDPSGTPVQKAITVLNLIYTWQGAVDANSQNLNNAVIVTPTIASFINAGHSHLNAAGGATLLLAAIADITISLADLNSLDDGVDSTLHFHAADRARAVHTGSQLASTISDFDTQVRTSKLEEMAAATDVTSRDATSSLHGLMPKLDKIKMDGISSGAEVNPDLISQGEAEGGSATTERIFSALRVKQAIDALAGGATVTRQQATDTAVRSTTSSSFVSANLSITVANRTGGKWMMVWNFTASQTSGGTGNYRLGGSGGVAANTLGTSPNPMALSNSGDLDGSSVSAEFKATSGTVQVQAGLNDVGALDVLEVS